MKKEELVKSEPELDDVDAEDTALEVDIILLQIRSMEGKLLRSQRRLCRRVSQAGKQRGPRERWFP